MKRIVVAPDSFKGSLPAGEVAAAMARGLRLADPGLEILCCPMADGGEGTLDAVAANCEGQRHEHAVTDANGRHKPVPWLRFRDAEGEAAMIEAAGIIGLPDARIDVRARSTAGVGELIAHLLDAGMDRIFVALGGTSTNDGGVGALSALGIRFLDAAGQAIAPTLAGLERLNTIDRSGLDARLARARLVLLTDVRNSLCGAQGATAVFGPQKGLGPEAVNECDALLARLARLGDEWAGCARSQAPGSGAAGGLAYGLMLVGASAESGAHHIARMTGLEQKMRGTDLVITGEGRSDLQTLMGKVPMQVAEMARKFGVPVWLVSGAIDPAALTELQRTFARCLAISDPGLPLMQAMAQTACNLERTLERAWDAWKSNGRGEP